MKRLHRLIAFSVLAAMILALVASAPARADKPPVERIHFEEDGTIFACGVEFPYHWEADLKYTYLCDEKRERKGDRCGDVYLWKQEWSFTYNGHELNLLGSSRERYTWITWYDTLFEISGSSGIGTLPGHGVVWGTVGRQVIYETCQGEYPDNWECEYKYLHEPGMVFDDYETVCNYMLYGE